MLVPAILAGTVHYQLFKTAYGCFHLGVVDGVEVDDALLVGVCDIFRNYEGEGEMALPHTVTTIKESIGPVIVDERLLSFIGVVHLANNLFLCIAHLCI